MDSPIATGDDELMNNNIATNAPKLIKKVIVAGEIDLLIFPDTKRPTITINQSVESIF